MNTQPEVSIVMIAFNEEKYIGKSIECILDQTYKNFELIIVDDFSSDNTLTKILKKRDNRIICIRNEKNLGPVESRNRGVEVSKGKYLFFTDGDCYPQKNWIFEGMKSFKKEVCIGVEGKIVLTPEGNAISDKNVMNINGNEYMTGNIAYRKEIFLKAGGFNNEFKDYYEDREIAIRIQKYGRIFFNEKMLVAHQLKKWSFKGFIKNAKKVKGLVLLYRRYNWQHYIIWRIIKPKELILIFFPFLIFIPIFQGRVKSLQDILFLPLIYIRAVYMRLIIWENAIKEGVFLI